MRSTAYKRTLVVTLAVLAIAAPVVAGALFSSAAIDGDIPEAVPLPPSPVSDSAHYVTDLDDVYRVDLLAGQWFYAALSSATGSDFDLHLFGPSIRSVSGTEAALASSEQATGVTERVLYQAKVSGRHYLDVWAYGGQGTYRLIYGFPSETPTLSVAASATCAWGASPAISGTMRSSSGAAVAGRGLYVLGRPRGTTSFRIVGRGTTDDRGTYRIAVKPTTATGYRVRFLGDPTYLPVTGSVTTITPFARLTRPSSPYHVKPGVTFVSAAYLAPRHAGGARSVRVWCYRLENDRWVRRKTVYATNANYYSYTKYSARISLPYSGRWRLVAYVPGDAVHAATTSSARYLTVTR